MDDSYIIAKIREPETLQYGFNLIVRQYQERVYWHIRKMVIDHDDADDLTQNTFIKVWNNLDSFRGDAGLFTWLYKIATNECLAFLKKKKRKFFIPIHDVQQELAGRIDDNATDGDAIQLMLQKALLQLPDKQRLVFNMKYFDDMKFDDISEVTGTSVGALKASYHHAVKKIENYLSSH